MLVIGAGHIAATAAMAASAAAVIPMTETLFFARVLLIVSPDTARH